MKDIKDFLPNVRCPYCNKSQLAAISGFGGELNNREKTCKQCEKTFFVQVLVETTENRLIADGKLRELKGQIEWLNRQREKTYVERGIEYSLAVQVNKEALIIAKEMYRKRKMN